MCEKEDIMAKTYTITMDGMNFTAPTQAEAVAMAKEFVKSFTPTTAGTNEKGKGKKITPHPKVRGVGIGLVLSYTELTLEGFESLFGDVFATVGSRLFASARWVFLNKGFAFG